jgi:hypothetical protein
MKTYRCHIKGEGFDRTQTGKRKVWRTDNIPTFCCEAIASFFIWERATKYNDYNPYSGYVRKEDIEIID